MNEEKKELFEAAMNALAKQWSNAPKDGKEETLVSTPWIQEQVEEAVGEVSKEDVATWMTAHGYELTWNKSMEKIDWAVYE